ERDKTKEQYEALKGEVNTQEATRQHCRQALDRAFKELPAAWHAPAERAGLTDLNRWKQEQDDLIGKRTEEREAQLREALVGLEGQGAGGAGGPAAGGGGRGGDAAQGSGSARARAGRLPRRGASGAGPGAGVAPGSPAGAAGAGRRTGAGPAEAGRSGGAAPP